MSLRIREVISVAVVGIALGAVATVVATDEWDILTRSSGSFSVRFAGEPVATLVPGLYGEGWRPAVLKVSRETGPGKGTGEIAVPGGGTVDCRFDVNATGKYVRVRYWLTPRQEVPLNSLHASLDLSMARMAGQTYRADGEIGVVPEHLGEQHLRTGPARTITLNVKDATPLTLALSESANVLFQDNRRWTDTLSVRMGAADEAGWPAGKTLSLSMTFSSPNGIRLRHDRPVTIREGEDWVPLQTELDIIPGSALDFSQMGQLDAPAGKHGWITRRADGKLVFPEHPDTPLRFYGVNLCFSANYLTHAESDRLADRLARLGYNAVRFHHHERELVDTSNGTSTSLLADPMDRLQYLFAALKKRGLYMTTDLYVSRPVFAREIYPDAPPAEKLSKDDAKMAFLINDRAFRNWADFSRNFMLRENSHTGRPMAHDPAMAWIVMINEGNTENFIDKLGERVRKDWTREWNRWLTEQYGSQAALRDAWGKDPMGDPATGTVPLMGNAQGTSKRELDLVRFCGKIEARAYARMERFVRDELGCRALLSNRNGWVNRLSTHASRLNYDYVDDHFYVDHPRFIEQNWRLPSRCPNTSPVASGARGGCANAFVRIFGKPFTISEYNYSAPGRFRGVGGILSGSLAAIQDWDVVWRFAYSHTRHRVIEPAPMHYFDLASDPLNQAADRASLCLYLRGDMKAAPHAVGIAMTTKELLDRPERNLPVHPPWSALAWVTKVGTVLTEKPDKAPVDIRLPLGWNGSERFQAATVLPGDPYAQQTAGEAIIETMRNKGWLNGNTTDLARKRLESETGELLIDAESDVMVLNTPRTAGGYAPEGETIKTDAVSIRIERTDATVWVSSLDGAPIPESKRLLVTHLTDLQNSGARFGETARETLLEWGELPHVVRDGEAAVSIRLNAAPTATVYALSTAGARLATIHDVERDRNHLHIPLKIRGANGAQILYEIAIE